MPRFSQHPHGTFCWPELVTTDAEGAKSFYQGLFGWDAHDDAVGPGRVYTMLRKGEHNVGALYRRGPQQEEQGVPPHWGHYISVEHLESAVGRARQLGANVLLEAYDVLDIGRMAVLQDPQGAVFHLWQALKHIGAEVKFEHGAMCWNELMTRDVADAERFYTGLFGWTADTRVIAGTPYTTYLRGEEPVAGMMAIDEKWGAVPPHWLLYLYVDDVDPVAQAAGELGGSVEVGPQDIPEVGRFAIVKDPQGAYFGIVSPNEPA